MSLHSEAYLLCGFVIQPQIKTETPFILPIENRVQQGRQVCVNNRLSGVQVGAGFCLSCARELSLQQEIAGAIGSLPPMPGPELACEGFDPKGDCEKQPCSGSFKTLGTFSY